MLSPRLIALLVCLMGGCGPTFLLGPLRPIPRGASDQPLYAQVRQFGVANPPFPVGESVQHGLTLDLHNRGTQPLLIDLPAGALVATPIETGAQQVARIV